MTDRLSTTPTLLLLGLLAGLGAHTLVPSAIAASAEDSHLRCRAFKQASEVGALVDTSDATSEVGQWVATEMAEGGHVVSVDLVLAQKPNGFPMGFAHVCMRRR